MIILKEDVYIVLLLRIYQNGIITMLGDGRALPGRFSRGLQKKRGGDSMTCFDTFMALIAVINLMLTVYSMK